MRLHTRLLLACWLALVFSAQAATNRFDSDIRAYVAADQTNPPPKNGVLFTGSSSIRLWKTLRQDFPDRPVFNRGFGGSQISDVIHFADRIVLPYEPRLIVFYAGGNDLNAGKSAEQVFADWQTFVQTVHAKLPKTRLAYISIAPNPARWKQIDRVRAANALIENHSRTDARLSFIDVHPAMMGDDGLPKPDIFVADKLHMNPRGYELWKGVVGAHLAKLLDAPKP
jgi:lysophospholipase L1-like esterase